jgi:hypothetical protein
MQEARGFTSVRKHHAIMSADIRRGVMVLVSERTSSDYVENREADQ